MCVAQRLSAHPLIIISNMQGVTQYTAVATEGGAAGEVKSLYRSRTDLSSRVGHASSLTPPLVVRTLTATLTAESCMERAVRLSNPRRAYVPLEKFLSRLKLARLQAKFEEASKLAGSEFFARLDYYFKAWLPARSLVVDALEKRKTNEVGDQMGRVLLFESFCPWKVDSLALLPLDGKLISPRDRNTSTRSKRPSPRACSPPSCRCTSSTLTSPVPGGSKPSLALPHPSSHASRCPRHGAECATRSCRRSSGCRTASLCTRAGSLEEIGLRPA